MGTAELFQRLALALALGLLIGLERGWREREGPRGSRTAGIRTYALIGLLGGLWAALLPVVGPIPLALAGIAVAAAVGFFAWRENVAREAFSVTGVIAALVTFALGAFALLGNVAAAVAAGVAAVAILTARTQLHDFLRRLTWPELRSAIVLLAMTFLALPLLPNRTVDPWGVLNPYSLWVLTVVIAALSFIGYIGVRLAGKEKGLLFAAVAGSLTSSTVMTLNIARLARGLEPAQQADFAVAIGVAWVVSLVRMTLVASALNIRLLALLAGPVAAASGILLLACLWFHRCAQAKREDTEFTLSNPFELRTVLTFGVVLALVIVATKLLNDAFGTAGLLPLAAVSGLADVDPVTLSVARLAGDAITPVAAAQAVLIAGAANIVTKASFALGLGGLRFGLLLAASGASAFIAGGLTAFFTLVLG